MHFRCGKGAPYAQLLTSSAAHFLEGPEGTGEVGTLLESYLQVTGEDLTASQRIGQR